MSVKVMVSVIQLTTSAGVGSGEGQSVKLLTKLLNYGQFTGIHETCKTTTQSSIIGQ